MYSLVCCIDELCEEKRSDPRDSPEEKNWLKESPVSSHNAAVVLAKVFVFDLDNHDGKNNEERDRTLSCVFCVKASACVHNLEKYPNTCFSVPKAFLYQKLFCTKNRKKSRRKYC